MPRLSPYLVVAEASGLGADELYLWNLQVSEAFYCSLHCLEICLRNSLNMQLTLLYHRADWWATAPLANHGQGKISDARTRAGQAQRQSGHLPRGEPAPDAIVAELSFGFWVNLLTRRFDRDLWVPALHRSFPAYQGAREPLRDNLEAMVHLRNRVMHHEPVHHRDLAADHAKAYRLIGYVEPELLPWLARFDRVPELLSRRPRTAAAS
jgi:hypothetical protein